MSLTLQYICTIIQGEARTLKRFAQPLSLACSNQVKRSV